MTVKSGFFSDGSSYNQADFNAFLLDSIGSGYVLGYGLELRVIQNSPANMGVLVRTGRCYVQGYYGWVTANEALTVPTANATNPRIDRVVARLSVSVNQSVTFAVLTGTPAANPSAPALTRTSETYEISLARIAVGAGVTSITAANITDERGDATVCGVAGVKHSWQYLSNVAIDVSEMSVDAGVSDRDPVYFNGTKWVVSTSGAVGFYDAANDAVITAGYLGGFTGLTPGAIVGNRGVALTTTKIVVLETPVDTGGYKQIGNVKGRVVITGCTWANTTLSGSEVRDSGCISILSSGTASSSTTTPTIVNRYLLYPYLGFVDLLPKVNMSITFTASVTGAASGPGIGAKLECYGITGTLLRTYSHYNFTGTATPDVVDLTDVFMLRITAIGNAGTSTAAGTITGIYVRLPYAESIIAP